MGLVVGENQALALSPLEEADVRDTLRLIRKVSAVVKAHLSDGTGIGPHFRDSVGRLHQLTESLYVLSIREDARREERNRAARGHP
jgi:hypothetical protein